MRRCCVVTRGENFFPHLGGAHASYELTRWRWGKRIELRRLFARAITGGKRVFVESRFYSCKMCWDMKQFAFIEGEFFNFLFGSSFR